MIHEQRFLKSPVFGKSTRHFPSATFQSATNRPCPCCTAVCILSSAHWETAELARIRQLVVVFSHMQRLLTFNLSDICLEIYLVSPVQCSILGPGLAEIFVSKCASSGSGDSASLRILAQLSETRQTC